MKIAKIIVGGCLIALCSLNYADTPVHTDLSKNWTCTTNASSSDKPEDKVADENLSKNKSSSKESFAAAEKNCRDCNKITCEMSAD